MVWGEARKFSWSGWLVWLTIFSVLFTGLQLSDISGLAPARAADPVAGYCRSVNGDGAARQTLASENGFYTSLESRASDSVTGLKITPVFSKRMYIDASKNFDATYVAYRIENTTATVYSNVQITLSGFEGTLIKPVSHEDQLAVVTIPAASGTGQNLVPGKVTAYFMLRASAPTEVFQRHDVRILNSAGTTQLAGCFTEIEGVQRSLSASANKVTGITVSTPTLGLGQTFTVAVAGAPGKVGSGSGPDLSVMAFSPASSSTWPTMAIRLEAVNFILYGVQGNTCQNLTTNGGSGADEASSSAKTATWNNTLAIRNFANCATGTKQTYVATYTFRLIGSAATNPVIRPLASIASGTQVKYTGSLPTVDVSVPITAAIKPVVTKTAAACTAGASGKLRVPFTVTVTLSSGSSVLDKIRDLPSATGATFVSATFTDATRTNSNISKTDYLETSSGKTYWDFIPTGGFAFSSTKNATLTYFVDYALPSSGTASYVNRAYAFYGDVVVASGDNVTGISTTLTSGSTNCGSSTTSDPKPKEPQIITFDPPATVGAGSTTTLSAYSDSGLPVTLSSLTPSTCTVSLFAGVYTVYAITEGAACTIRASQSGNATFDAALNSDKSITILKGQVITYTAGIFGGASTTTVQVQATSKLEVSLISIDTSVCTVSNTKAVAYNAASGSTTYTIVKDAVNTGSCILSASQLGDSTWGPAPSRDITIGVGAAQYIDLTSPAINATYATTTTSFSAVASARVNSTTTANLPVYFSSTTPLVCAVVQAVDSANLVVSGYDSGTGATTVTINITGPGTCTLTANQDGLKDDGTQSTFASAAQVTRSILITGTGNTNQNLTFTDPGSKNYGDASFNVNAVSKTDGGTATGLLVDLQTTTLDVCTLGNGALSGTESVIAVRLLTVGTCTITANQAGNNTYKKATAATLNITISPKELSITSVTATKVYDAGTAVTFSGATALSGVVTGDGFTEIALAGTPTGTYPDKDVAPSKSISVTGFSLTGTKATSYTLAPLTINGSITARPISIAYSDATMSTSETPPTCTVAETAIQSGSLAGTDVISAISCSGIPEPWVQGTYPVTPSAAVIKASSAGGAANVTTNYLVSYVSGNLIVTSKTVPTLEVASKTVVYGSLLSELETTSISSSGVKGKSGSDILPGSITHKQSNGSAITGELAAGTYTFDVEFSPTDTTRYSKAQSTRTVIIVKRKLRIAGITAVSKVYDGNATAAISGTPTIEADPTDSAVSGKTAEAGYGLGIYSTDDVTIDPDVTATIEFSSAAAGDSKVVTYSGRALRGAKAANYELASSVNLTANIIKRKLTYAGVQIADKVYDGGLTAEVVGTPSLEPLPVLQGGDGGGVVPNDNADVVLAGTTSAAFTSANVGEAVSTTVTGRTLAGNKSGNYELSQPTGVTGKILARKLTITGLTGINKVYDGTKTATTSGSAQLAALPLVNGGNATGGIVAGDVGNVRLESASDAVTEFADENASTSKTIALTGKSLTGSKAGNYSLHASPGLTATISKRPLKLRANSVSKLVGATDPTLTYSLADDTTFAAGESQSTIGGITISRTSGTVAGQYAISVGTQSPGHSIARDNYLIESVDATLYIAKATITTQKDNAGAHVVAPQVDCGCEGFKPGATVTLKMFSVETILATDVVAADGTCPGLTGSIPAGTEGSHNLEITSSFPNNDPIVYRDPILLAASTPTSSPSPTATPTSTPTPTPTASSSATPEPTPTVTPPKTFTVKLNYVPGTSGPTELVYVVGTEGVELPKTLLKGLNFIGWSPESITRTAVPNVYKPTGNVNLYQVWKNLPANTQVFFGGDSPVLSKETRVLLASLSKRVAGLSQQPQLIVDGWVKRTKDTSYDQRLSNQRAINTAAYLKRLGVNAVVLDLTPRGISPIKSAKARRVDVAVYFSGPGKKTTLVAGANR
jgi:hypothetical protein